MPSTFCKICQNLLFVKVVDDGRLVASCNYCLTKEDMASDRHGAVVVSETSYKTDAAKYSHLTTPLLHEDPTLPRVTDVRCPNPRCVKRSGDADRALFVKYDGDNMRFLYSCCFCKHFWVPGAAARGSTEAPAIEDGAPRIATAAFESP